MKYFTRLLPLAGWLLSLGAAPVRAQQAPPTAPATDVLLLTDGQELPGRVLSIDPVELTYLPAPTSPTAPPLADTLRLPVARVFLVRYANGARELISQLLPAPAVPFDPTPAPLRGLDNWQRENLGHRDAQLGYRPTQPFWGAAVGGFCLGPLLGVGSTVAIANSGVKPHNLRAPQPALLADPSYRLGYQEEANRLKHRRAWGGYGLGVGLLLLLVLSSGQ